MGHFVLVLTVTFEVGWSKLMRAVHIIYIYLYRHACFQLYLRYICLISPKVQMGSRLTTQYSLDYLYTTVSLYRDGGGSGVLRCPLADNANVFRFSSCPEKICELYCYSHWTHSLAIAIIAIIAIIDNDNSNSNNDSNRNYLEVYWPCAGGLSVVDAIGTQLRDPINSGLTRWRMAVS